MRIADDAGVGLRAGHLDAGKILASAPTDHARDPEQVLSEAPRANPHEADSRLLLETRLIVLEPPDASVERRPDFRGCGHAGHLPHGRAQPVGVQASVATLATRGAGVVSAQDVAAHDHGFANCG